MLTGLQNAFAARRRSIYIDLTDLLEYARHHHTVAGIIRVSLMVAGHLVQKQGGDTVKLIAWHPLKAAPFELENDWCTADYQYDRNEFCKWFDLDRSAVRTIARWAAKFYPNRSLRRKYHTFRAHTMAILKNETFFRKRRIDLPHTIGRKLLPLSLRPGDVIVMMGATWNFDSYMAFLNRQKQMGVLVYTFVHDLIPLLMPEHVVDGVPDQFEQWLQTMCGLASGFLTNSQSTARDLRSKLAFHEHPPPIHVIPLAQEFLTPTVAPTRAMKMKKPRARVLSDARLPFVLCVGTIESRKNVWALSKVWQALSAELGLNTPRLVFAGKHGWLKEDFDDLMRATGNLGGLVRIVDGPTEQELAFLYSKCLFTVFPSYYEGWGLPVGESLSFGKVCVTSRAGAMPEVGQDMCPYVDPRNLDELYAVLKRMLTDQSYRTDYEKRIAECKLRTWSDVADGLWSVLSHEVSIGSST